MDVRVLLRQKFSLRLGPHHERVHRPPDASLRPSGTPSLASGHTTGRQRRAATQHGLGGGGPPLSPPGLGGGRLWREVQRLVGRGAVAVAVVMVMRRVRRGVSVVRVRGWRREGEAGQHVETASGVRDPALAGENAADAGDADAVGEDGVAAPVGAGTYDDGGGGAACIDAESRQNAGR